MTCTGVVFEEGEYESLEQAYAYMFATGVIESSCVIERDDTGEPWFDLGTAEVDVTDEVKYLQARRLLRLHPTNPRWVSFCDDDEPNAEVIQ